MKTLLLTVGILCLIACALFLLLSAFCRIGYYRLMDGSADLYRRLRRRTVSSLVVGTTLGVIGIISLVGAFSVQSSIILGEDGLIAKARVEIKNLAEVETIEMTVAGKSTIDNDRHLFWIITGNEYQAHRYYPLEVIEQESGEYKFVKLYNGGHERGRDIFFEYFGSGYSFVINNPKCKSIVIGETVIPVTETPFVYYCPFAPNEYYFLDEAGNNLN